MGVNGGWALSFQETAQPRLQCCCPLSIVGSDTPMRTVVRCPTCRRPVVWQENPHRPFCSERCRLIDLGQWADERYRIPGESTDNSALKDPSDDAEEP
jgi:hypothetical protein